MKNITYCDLEVFGNHYKQYIHGYLSLCVCGFGSVANVFNICVLGTKNMRSPTNSILTGLAIADILVMFHYVPFTIHRNFPSSPVHYTHFSQSWALFYKYHALFTLVLHFISCTLTIVLAIWRYVLISQVHTNRVCSSQGKTVMVILITYVVCPIICIPILSTIDIFPYLHPCDLKGFIVDKSERHLYNSSQITNEKIYLLYPNDPFNLSLWIYTVLLKFIPCVLLTLLSYKIISALLEARRRRVNLLGGNNAEERKKAKTNAIHLYKENQADRTTRMLLAVLILFLITEFPQAILGLISAILGGRFLEECYTPLGDMMDMMALINSSINFILYCTMSRQFRSTFQEMFRVKEIVGWIRRRSSNTLTLTEETRGDTKMSLV